MTFLLGGVGPAFYYARQPIPSPDTLATRRPDSAQSAETLAGDTIERLRARIAELGAEAERRQQVARQMIRRQRLHRRIAGLEQELEEPNPLELARIEIEKTAFLLVDRAEQHAKGARADSARDEYRRILTLFPKTNAAKTAQEQLDQSSVEKGDP